MRNSEKTWNLSSWQITVISKIYLPVYGLTKCWGMWDPLPSNLIRKETFVRELVTVVKQLFWNWSRTFTVPLTGIGTFSWQVQSCLVNLATDLSKLKGSIPRERLVFLSDSLQSSLFCWVLNLFLSANCFSFLCSTFSSYNDIIWSLKIPKYYCLSYSC